MKTFLFAICFAATALFAQDQRQLAFRPVSAEWSEPLQRVIAISSSPNQLAILDPATNTYTSVELAKAPLSLAISLNGFFAAVGHDSLVSYINLSTGLLVRATNVSGAVNSLATNNDWIYSNAFGAMRASTGEVATGSNSYFVGNYPKIDPSGNTLFGYYGARFDISAGPLGNQNYASNPFFYDSNYSFSRDGLRVYLNFGAILFRPTLNSELSYHLKVDAAVAVAESASQVALILQPQTYNSANLKDNEIALYGSQYVGLTGHLVIPDFIVNSRSYQAHGKWAFFDATGANLYVISQADSTSGLLNDFGIYKAPLASPNPCTATFATSSAGSHFYGSTIAVGIRAAQNCFYQATTTDASWIRLGSGAFGSGDGTLTIAIRPNRSASSRTGVVSLGSQQFTITQPAFGPAENLVKLPSKIANVAYSNALGVLVAAVSDPPELLLQNATGDVFIPLIKKPLSVGVHPDGRSAVVGFDGFATVVDLASRTSIKTFPISGDATRTSVASNGFAYANSARAHALISLNLNSGTAEGGNSNYYDPVPYPPTPAIHPSGASVYFDNTKYDITGGVARSLYSVYFSNCPDMIVTEDGLRLVDNCGKVFRSSDVQSQDFQPNGSLSAATGGLSSKMHVGARRSLVVTTSPTTNVAADTNGIELQTYSDETLGMTGRTTLPQFTVGANQYKGVGRYLFWANGGPGQTPDRILAVIQADSASGLISDFGYTTYLPGQASGCVSLPSNSTSLAATAGTGTFTVNTNAACMWDAKSEANWIYVISGGLTVGNGTVSFSVQPNTTGAARSGAINVGGLVYTVNQAAGAGTITLSPLSSNSSPFGGSLLITVTSTSPSLAWTATSNSPWITVSEGAAGTGTGSVRLNIASNTLSIPRTGTVTIAGQLVSVTQAASNGMQFVPVAPCRILDTRRSNGTFGGPFLNAGGSRDFPVPQSACGIPANAVAYSLNLTAVPRGALGYITIWPAGSTRPLASTLNSTDGRVKANGAIVQAGANGAVSVYATDATDVVLDINGYFVPPQGDGLVFYPLTPCRLYDSRLYSTFPARETRTLSPYGVCQVPNTAKALSLNATVVPRGLFGYLTLWPEGIVQPDVSTLNAVTGAVTANAAIVPISPLYGNLKIFVSDSADVVLDVNGFFAPPGGGNALQFYPITPCRVSDTRNPVGALGGPALVAGATRSLPVNQSACGIPAEARAFAVNTTVVPSGVFGYLSLWPTGAAQPVVSTLNAVDGFITSNMAIVPAGTNGSINVFGSNAAHVLFDITGYFAP